MASLGSKPIPRWPLVSILLLSLRGGTSAATWPILSTEANYDALSGTFAECRSNPSGSNNCAEFHGGIDILPTLNCGTTVYAAISGTATFSFNAIGGYTVTIDDKFHYVHLATHTWPTQQYVSQGSSIGITSNSPYTSSFACHLHFETWDTPTSWSTFLFQKTNPLKKFAVQDTTGGRIGEVLLRQGSSSTTIAAGSVANLSGALELVAEGADGSNRFLPIIGSTTSVNWARFRAIIDTGTVVQDFYFGQIPVSGSVPDPADADDVYSLASPASTFNPFKTWYRMGPLFSLSEGWHYLCLTGYGLNYSQLRLSANTCFNFAIDRTAPDSGMRDANGASLYDGGASSMTSVTVTSTDTYGVQKIALTKTSGGGPAYSQTSTNPAVSTTYDATFSSLSTGTYAAVVYDLANNLASKNFSVSDSEAGSDKRDANNNSLSGNHGSDLCEVMKASEAIAGIRMISRNGVSSSASATYSCVSEAGFGPFCEQAAGSYEWAMETCAGVRSVVTTTITATSLKLEITAGSMSDSEVITADQINTGYMRIDVCGESNPNCTHCNADRWAEITLNGAGAQFCGEPRGQPGSRCCRYVLPAMGSQGFGVTNTTNTTVSFNLLTEVSVNKDSAPGQFHVIASTAVLYGGGLSGDITLGQIGLPQLGGIGSGATGYIMTPLAGVAASPTSCGGLNYRLLRLFWTNAPCISIAGSEYVFTSSGTLSLSFPTTESGVTVDTTTLALYRLYDNDWSSAAISNQTITTSAATGLATIEGRYMRTGEFGAFFITSDSSAPVTTASFQGSSYAFNGNVFVSTSAYLVLSATDTPVNGFASQVATTYYRLDATSSTTSFSVYSSSIPMALGFHVFEYKSVDYAGNTETVRTSTFLVTAGTLFKGSGDLVVSSSLLAGFLSYGVQADIQSRIQNSYTLLVSSADKSPLLSVSNIGQVALGAYASAANLELMPSSASEPLLSLRGGNASTATPSAQIAFGYNNDVSMRHAIRTEHATTAAGNALDFLLWYPVTGSTTTLGNLNVLSLQGIAAANGGSFHVHTASAAADAEVEVSDGGTTGAGVVHRVAIYAASSREFKSDIRYLTPAEQRLAFEETLALRHASFRYKTSSSRSPARKGLIFEETPASIQGAGEAVILDERVVNVELALKEAMERLESLQKRLEALKNP